MEKSAGCLICETELVYSEQNELNSCAYCGQQYSTNVKCPNNHFVCDTCHGKDAVSLIETYCLNSESQNPMEMAVELMQNSAIKMHGPEHHYLVAAVLVSAYYNVCNLPDEKESKLSVAKERAAKVPGGFCGTHGNCGAGVATGIFTSIITNASPLTGLSWQQSNLLTAKSLLAIAEQGGPRCCKRDAFIAINEAIDFTALNFEIQMKKENKVTCNFVKKNKQCIGTECHFFPV